MLPNRLSVRCCRPPMPDRPQRARVALQPGGLVETVNRLLDDVIATQPRVIQPVANLVFHPAPFRIVAAKPLGARVVVRLDRHDVANRAVLNPRDRLLDLRRVPPAQPGNDRQAFLFRLLARRQHLWTPGTSVAIGFSTNACLPFSTAYRKCSGRKWGGVVRITISTPLSITFL